MIYGLISVAAGAVFVFQNFKTVKIGPGFLVACNDPFEDRGNFYIYLLSVMHGWKKITLFYTDLCTFFPFFLQL